MYVEVRVIASPSWASYESNHISQNYGIPKSYLKIQTSAFIAKPSELGKNIWFLLPP